MYQMEKNIAEKHVETREAKMWKSRVNATTRRVHSHFGSSRMTLPLTWPVDDDKSSGSRDADAAGELM